MRFGVKMRFQENFALDLVVNGEVVDASEVSITEVLKVRSMAENNVAATGGCLSVRFYSVRKRDISDSFSVSSVHGGATLVTIDHPASILREIVSLVVSSIGFLDYFVVFETVGSCLSVSIEVFV